MTNGRRMGAEESRSRSRLIEAAEQLIRTDGYAAVSARAVAERAALKPQLVHYYFRNMDALYMAAFDLMAQKYRQLYDEALGSPHPLKAVWRLHSDPLNAALIVEFLALANHRATIRDDIVRATVDFRAGLVADLERLLGSDAAATRGNSPMALVMMMHTISTTLVLEKNAGITDGHDDILAIVEREIERLEGAIGGADRSSV